MGNQQEREEWLLVNIPASKEFALWWRPESRGYTTNILEAGRYSKRDAEFIAGRSGGEVRAIPPKVFAGLLSRTVVPMEENFTALTGKAHK